MSQLDRAEVSRRRARAGRIRQGIQSYISTLADVAAAYAERDWEVLGYESWEAYVDEEFGADRLRLTPEHRQKAVQELRLAGLSQRAIGSALGVSASTVNADLAGVQNRTPDEAPAQVKGVDGKTYTTKTPAPRDPEPVHSGPAVATPGEPDQQTADSAEKTPARPDSTTSADRGPESSSKGGPDQPGEAVSAGGGGAVSPIQPPAGRGASAPTPDPDRPGLREFVDEDPRVQSADFMARFTTSLARAGAFMQFDAERVGQLAGQSTWDAIEAHASVVEHWFETARKARTGLRVIKGGVA